MLNTKRLFIATLFGLIFGFVCYGLASASGPAWFIIVSIILGRTLIGFTIGISILKIKWWLHGIIIGFLVSLPMAFPTIAMPEKGMSIFIGTIVMGIIYGFLIELFTTIVFKAKA